LQGSEAEQFGLKPGYCIMGLAEIWCIQYLGKHVVTPQARGEILMLLQKYLLAKYKLSAQNFSSNNKNIPNNFPFLGGMRKPCKGLCADGSEGGKRRSTRVSEGEVVAHFT
jgi:hypothetical protein